MKHIKIDIDKIRKDIPHYDAIFFNSAGSSLMPASVVKEINAYLLEEERFGGYAVAETKTAEIEEFYIQVAELIGAQPNNIAFANSATDAYAKALSSIHFDADDTILTTDDDYISNHLQFLSLKKRFGIKIIRIKNLENGDLDMADFQKLVDSHQPKLVAVTHVPTNSGMIQNVEAIGEICWNEDITYLLDACQSVGQLDVDVKKIKCDFLTATGRKFLRGPRGTGFLYVSDRLLNKDFYPLMIDGCGAVWTDTDQFEIFKTAKRFEIWEKPQALIVGFTSALKYANEIGIKNIAAYNEQLMTHLRKNLSAVKGVNQFDQGSKKCNILTFGKEGKLLPTIKAHLEQNNIAFSMSTKEWGLIDFNNKGITGAVRLSPHYFNTLVEIDAVTTVIDAV